MMSLVFNRFEKKYVLSIDVYHEILDKLLLKMNLDKNNVDEFMKVQSIYFDTDNNDYIRNSISKPYYKEKIRIRGYNFIDSDSELFLEVKRKIDGKVNKRRTNIKLSDIDNLIENNTIEYNNEYMNKQVLNEINYILNRDHLLPKLFVSYERCALVDNHSDLRITFDKNITGSSNKISFNIKTDQQLLNSKLMIMEVKTCYGMPRWLLEIIENNDIKKASFSKYGTSYKNELLKRKDNIYEYVSK